MRSLLAVLVSAAVLATAFVSVRLHLHVTQMRYRLWAQEQDRLRAERGHRTARADLEADKAPRRLMERYAELRGVPGVGAGARLVTPAEVAAADAGVAADDGGLDPPDDAEPRVAPDEER